MLVKNIILHKEVKVKKRTELGKPVQNVQNNRKQRIENPNSGFLLELKTSVESETLE
jgi:hypothetical protein